MCRDAKDKCHMKLFLVSFNWKLNLVTVSTPHGIIVQFMHSGMALHV